mgnify:CR=1 FL=1
MKICIGGGEETAIYIVRAFNTPGNEISVINGDKEICNSIVKICHTPVLNSDPTKIYSFEEAGLKNYDIFIALSEKDSNNFVMCQIAKKLFNFKKTIALVNNPNNVALFKELGVDSPISSIFMLTQTIKNESNFVNIFSTTSLENEKIVLTEIIIEKNFKIANRLIKDIHLPRNVNIACIFRDPKVIVPNGNDQILPGDKLLLVSAPEIQKNLVKFVRS